MRVFNPMSDGIFANWPRVAIAGNATATPGTWSDVTAAAPLTVSCPAAPADGDAIAVARVSGASGITIAGNGHTIDGAASLALPAAVGSLAIVMFDATANLWRQVLIPRIVDGVPLPLYGVADTSPFPPAGASLVLIDMTAGPAAVTLPAASSRTLGQTVTVKATTVANNLCTVSPTGADTIDGGASDAFSSVNSQVGRVYASDGVSNWALVAGWG